MLLYYIQYVWAIITECPKFFSLEVAVLHLWYLLLQLSIAVWVVTAVAIIDYKAFFFIKVQTHKLPYVLTKFNTSIPSKPNITNLLIPIHRSLLRDTKASQLQSVGEGSNNNSFLGKQGQDFEFSHLGSMKVEFVEAVAKGGENLTPITSWLQQVAWGISWRWLKMTY